MQDEFKANQEIDELTRKAREFLAEGDNKKRMEQKLREEVHFDDEAIIRYTKMRLQIDADPAR
jgi:hypothetical protein